MNLFDKIFGKVMAVFVVIVVLVSVRSMILADSDMNLLVSNLLSMLPFSRFVYDTLQGFLKINIGLPINTVGGFFINLMRLAVLAVIQPAATRLLQTLLIPLPPLSNREAVEDYMSSIGYRLKSLLITILTAPVLSWVANKLILIAYQWLVARMGQVLTVILGYVSIIGITWFAIMAATVTMTLGQAIAWKLGNLGIKMFSAFFLNFLCMGICMGLLGDSSGMIISCVVGILVLFVAVDLMTTGLKRIFL